MLTIAEIGSNYRDFDDILNYAYRLDADVIKLQYYTSYDLYGYGVKCKDVTHQVWQLVELKETLRSLKKKLMISLFNHNRVEDLDPLIDYHKVASSEITYLPLLAALAKTGKDVFVSTGGATSEEIAEAVKIIGKDKIILMGCNVEYPTTRSWPLAAMEMGLRHDCRWGYSDHSKEVFLVYDYCLDLGAHCWEKHVKFVGINDKPDSDVAITVNEFNAAVKSNWIQPANPHKRIYRNGKWVRPT